MSIKIIEGKIICSLCNRVLEKEEPFKLDEFRYEIACLDCDKKYNFSHYILINCNTPRKQHLLDLIDKYMKENETLSIDMDKVRKFLLNDS